MDAAKYWSNGGVIDESNDDASAFGIELPKANDVINCFEVWPENWDIVMMWLRVSTQWRASASGIIGLDYGVLPWIFKLYDVSEEKEMLEGLRLMEQTCLECMS